MIPDHTAPQYPKRKRGAPSPRTPAPSMPGSGASNALRQFLVFSCSFSFLIFTFSFVLSGCGNPIFTHNAPGEVNAKLPGDQIWDDPFPDRPDADIILTATCLSAQPYHTETSGLWDQTWHFTTWQVESILKGQWPSEQLAFVYYTRTPETKAVYRLAPTPFRPNTTVRFYLNQSWGLPTITAHQPL